MSNLIDRITPDDVDLAGEIRYTARERSHVPDALTILLSNSQVSSIVRALLYLLLTKELAPFTILEIAETSQRNFIQRRVGQYIYQRQAQFPDSDVQRRARDFIERTTRMT